MALPHLLSKQSISTLLACAALATGQAYAQAAPADTKAAPANNGFLTGLKGFEHFHEAVGQPIYFESPFNDTSLRAIYLQHNFGDDSVLGGGNVTVYALQARLALTERLGLIATKDGYSVLDADNLPEEEGWNDLAAGLKYVLIADKATDFVVTPGIRYQCSNGTTAVLQGGVAEVSPFLSIAKGFTDLHFIANATLRVPTNQDDGNVVGHWDVHADYDLNPKADCVVAPVAEIHGVHYLDDGASSLPIGGLDYTNLGSQPAENFVCWAGIGLRAEFSQRYEIGAVYEFALTDPDDDIMDTRITVDFIVRW